MKAAIIALSVALAAACVAVAWLVVEDDPAVNLVEEVVDRANDRAEYVNTVIRDIATIQVGVKMTVFDDAICCGDDTADLTRWSQLEGFLSGELRDVAKNEESDTLSGANPWGGDYVLIVNEARPRYYTLRITGIDASTVAMLEGKLAEGSEAITSTGEVIQVTYPI